MYIEDPNLEDLLLSKEHLSVSNQDFLLLMIGEECEIPLKCIVDALNAEKINFVGGIFPKVISNQKTSSKGIVIKKIKGEIVSIHFNSSDSFASQFSDYTHCDFVTVYTLTSGLSLEISDHLMTLYTHLGNDVKFLGGGVGRSSRVESELLISNDGIFHKGTIVVLTKNNTAISAMHGWKKLIGPFIVTKANNHIIEELNWENAFEVYNRCLKQSQNIDLDINNFNSYSIHFPFGIHKEDREYIVRDPIEVNEDGFITCVGNIPENSLVDLLSIKIEDLKKIPETMVRDCSKQKFEPNDVILFDCISRANHLNENFLIELNGFTTEIKKKNPDIDLEGALSIGEIYSSGDGYLELLNKSVVLGFL